MKTINAFDLTILVIQVVCFYMVVCWAVIIIGKQVIESVKKADW